MAITLTRNRTCGHPVRGNYCGAPATTLVPFACSTHGVVIEGPCDEHLAWYLRTTGFYTCIQCGHELTRGEPVSL